MAIELVPLATATCRIGEPLVLPDTPSGLRMISEISGARWEGERLTASQKGGAAADWLVLGVDGTGLVDVRLTLETDDGALVFVSYGGRAYFPADGPQQIMSAPRFETGDPRYAWLNRVQGVAKGALDGLDLTYEVFEAR